MKFPISIFHFQFLGANENRKPNAQCIHSVIVEINFVRVYLAEECEEHFEEAVRHRFGVGVVDFAGERVAESVVVYVSVLDLRFDEASGGSVLDFCAVGAVHRGNPSFSYQASTLDVFAESDVVVELQCENRGLERCN